MAETVDFEKLPLKERMIETTSSKLIKHFRGLEMSGARGREYTASMIGCIKKLVSLARGEEPKEEKK